jgi:hypothetical protein
MEKQDKTDMKVIVKILKQEEEQAKKLKPRPSIDPNDFGKKTKRLKVEFII